MLFGAAYKLTPSVISSFLRLRYIMGSSLTDPATSSSHHVMDTRGLDTP